MGWTHPPHTPAAVCTPKKDQILINWRGFPSTQIPGTRTQLRLQDSHKGQAMNRSRTTAYLPFYSFQSPCLPFPFLKIKEKALYSRCHPINSSQRLQNSNHKTRPWLGLKSLHGINSEEIPTFLLRKSSSKGEKPTGISTWKAECVLLF